MSSDHTHPCTAHCGRPAEGYYLCRWCADELAHQLAQVVTVAAELTITVTRQARMSQPVAVATSGPAPLPYDPHASDALNTLDNTLSTWARDVSERLGHTLDAEDTGGAARWLRARRDALRSHPAAGELADEIAHAVGHAWRAVDRAPGRVYIGPCGADTGNGPCPLDLYGRADPSRPGRLDPRQSVVRCPCGAQWNATQRREWLLDRLNESLATAREIASAVGVIGGLAINEKTIRTWHNRGRISARGRNPAGVPLHRIGDVVHVATSSATRRRAGSHARPSYA